MKEEQMIAKITRDSFKQRELRFSRIEILEKNKVELDDLLKFKQKSIDRYIKFYETCHSFTAKELYFHPIVLGVLQLGSLKVYQLSPDGLKWEFWVYNKEEYPGKVDRGELIFHVPLKKQIGIIIDIYKRGEMYPIFKKKQVIDRRIDRAKHELSIIQSTELHKIRIEEAFLNNKFVNIFREFNTLIYSVSQTVDQVVKYKKMVDTKHLNVCIQMMRRFNEKRMILWLTKGMDEIYSSTVSVTNTYRLLSPMFNILMRMEKLVKTRIRRNTIYVRPALIASFIKEINLFKKHHNNIWISFYTSSVPYIFKNNNFSDILIQHIYEYIYGMDKPIIYEYKRPVRILPQPRSLAP